jgi:hypothetical protein
LIAGGEVKTLSSSSMGQTELSASIEYFLAVAASGSIYCLHRTIILNGTDEWIASNYLAVVLYFGISMAVSNWKSF